MSFIKKYKLIFWGSSLGPITFIFHLLFGTVFFTKGIDNQSVEIISRLALYNIFSGLITGYMYHLFFSKYLLTCRKLKRMTLSIIIGGVCTPMFTFIILAFVYSPSSTNSLVFQVMLLAAFLTIVPGLIYGGITSTTLNP